MPQRRYPASGARRRSGTGGNAIGLFGSGGGDARFIGHAGDGGNAGTGGAFDATGGGGGNTALIGNGGNGGWGQGPGGTGGLLLGQYGDQRLAHSQLADPSV